MPEKGPECVPRQRGRSCLTNCNQGKGKEHILCVPDESLLQHVSHLCVVFFASAGESLVQNVLSRQSFPVWMQYQKLYLVYSQ